MYRSKVDDELVNSDTDVFHHLRSVHEIKRARTCRVVEQLHGVEKISDRVDGDVEAIVLVDHKAKFLADQTADTE